LPADNRPRLDVFKGAGVATNTAEAVEWFRRAAEQGNALAQSNLGVMYQHGESIPKDAAQAVAWNRNAAEQGYAEAQYNLGVMYEHGEGVPKDLVQAHKWVSLAASSGRPKAREVLTRMERDMTKKQQAEADKLAREWYEAHRHEKQ
jgi:TPR repeat protein